MLPACVYVDPTRLPCRVLDCEPGLAAIVLGPRPYAKSGA